MRRLRRGLGTAPTSYEAQNLSSVFASVSGRLVGGPRAY